MKKSFLFIAMLALVTANLFSQTSKGKIKTTIVIVHGAWMDITYWDKVIPLLKASGNEVIGVNLPGHGKDNTPIPSISLQSYVDAVKKAIGNRKDVLLVGHSMAGLVVSQVAEQIPSQIKRLIYIGAYLPKNGESLLSLANTDAESHIPKFLKVDEKNGIASIGTDGLKEIFAEDASQADIDKMVANNKPDPLAPLATPVTLTDQNFGSTKKVIVFTENDHAVGYKLQQRMMQAATNVVKTYTLPSSHTPFLNMPEVIAAVILHEVK